MEENRELCFPEVLKSLIKRDGLRLDDLAAKIGTTKQAISTYTTGKSAPSYKTLVKIASFFGVSLDYLITGQNPENKILSTELGLSEGTLRTLKELAGNVHSEKSFRLLAYIDKLLSDPDFLETLRQTAYWFEYDASIYPEVQQAMEAKGKGERSTPELYMNFVETEAAREMFTFFKNFFRANNFARNRYIKN